MRYAAEAVNRGRSRVKLPRLARQRRAAAKGMCEHPAVGDDHVIAAGRTADARQHDVFIGIEIDTECCGDTAVIPFISEALVKPHALAASRPLAVRPSSPSRPISFSYDLGPERRRIAWEGLAELLHQIEIDEALISHALMTPIKERMLMHSFDPVELWFRSDDTVEAWPPGCFATGDWLYFKYKLWAEEHEMFPNCRSKQYFDRKLAEIRSSGLISDQKSLRACRAWSAAVEYVGEPYGGHRIPGAGRSRDRHGPESLPSTK